MKYKTFKPFQKEAIESILDGRNTMVNIPTGGGKSFCYQLMAYLLRQKHTNNETRQPIVIVVSPTISLMHDQMNRLPTCIRGGMLSGSITEQKQVYEKIENDEIDVLFLSPERFSCIGFIEFSSRIKVSIVCVDEIHCVSEWSHNFRSAYISLPTRISELFGKVLFIGLSATSTVSSRLDIARMFDCHIVGGTSKIIADNFRITISKTQNKDTDLVKLLESPRFKTLDSIIVYTMFQNQADRVCQMLVRRGINSDVYHGGKTAAQKSATQKRFMSGRTRVLVATIAFGLGVDKSNVQSVIHYSLPKSLENYVQEIGRSGRDGRECFCHLFVDEQDYIKQRGFSYSDGVEESSIWRFLLKVFGCQGGKVTPIVTLGLDEISTLFDMNEVQIGTLLRYIALDSEDWIEDFGGNLI